jgi:hypothetical protein
MKSIFALSLLALATVSNAPAMEFDFKLESTQLNRNGNFVSAPIREDRENIVIYEIVPATDALMKAFVKSDPSCILVVDGSVISRSIQRDDELRQVTETTTILARKITACR